MKPAQRIVIAGASSGIGAALVRALAGDGHAVFACARREDRLRGLAQSLSGVFVRRCDVSQEADVEAFAAWVRSQADGVDALVNCAGGFGAIGPAAQTDSRAWWRTLETNLLGTYLIIKHLVPMMKPASRPRIINFSGGGAFEPFPRYSAYAVSKAAVVRLTETLAVELAPRGITVNAVAPGFVATEIHQDTLRSGVALAGAEHFERTRQRLREGGVPIEVPVACVRFLLSERAAGLTGKTLSASFDPWDSPAFVERIPQISASGLYTMQRINLVHLPDDDLRRALEEARDGLAAAAARHGAA